MTDRAGQQLGNYHLIRLLGQGGFAQVYLGEHIHLETQAAIKVLNIQQTAAGVPSPGRGRDSCRPLHAPDSA